LRVQLGFLVSSLQLHIYLRSQLSIFKSASCLTVAISLPLIKDDLVHGRADGLRKAQRFDRQPCLTSFHVEHIDAGPPCVSGGSSILVYLGSSATTCLTNLLGVLSIPVAVDMEIQNMVISATTRVVRYGTACLRRSVDDDTISILVVLRY
jgi:hypothetical protein